MSTRQVDTAVELHLYAGRPREALQLLMQRLSDALPGSLTNAAKGTSCWFLMCRCVSKDAIRMLMQTVDSK